MNQVIKSPMPLPEKQSPAVFLAGPMKGAPKWQKTVPDLAEEIGIEGVTFYNPCPCQRWVNWKTQADWESNGLAKADVVLFWIPNQAEALEGHDYAQTTRMELLESLALGRKVILGIDSDIRGARYMKYKAKAYGLAHIHSSLQGCLSELKEVLTAGR